MEPLDSTLLKDDDAFLELVELLLYTVKKFFDIPVPGRDVTY